MLYEKPRSDEMMAMRMEWGKGHEANCYSIFLPPNQTFKQLVQFKDSTIIRVEESTFQRLTSLPSSILAKCIHGQPEQARTTFFPSLPPIGASPDGILVHSINGKDERLPLEFKCPFPFSPDGGPSESLTYQFTPSMHWSKLPAPYYAQCQMTMMVADSPRMLLVQYTTERTMILQVKRDDDWLGLMLPLLRISHIKNTPVSDAVRSSDAIKKLYGMLLHRTREGIQTMVKELGTVDSVNGPDSARFKS